MWRSRTFWRLFGMFGALMLCAIWVLGIVVTRRVEQHYLRHLQETLCARAILIGNAERELPSALTAEQKAELQDRVRELGRNEKIATRITLLNAGGDVLADSEKDPSRMENHADRPEIQAARVSGFGMSQERQSATLEKKMMYVAMRQDNQGAVAYVRVALPLTEVHGQLAELDHIIWMTAAATSIAAMLLAFWLARRLARPLHELTSAAQSLASPLAFNPAPQRVYVAGNDELAILARSFNEMSDRVNKQFTQLQEDRQQLRAILTGMVEGVIAVDADQRILFANKRAGQVLEFQAEACTGRRLWEVTRHRPVQEIVQKALAESTCCSEELVWKGRDATSLLVHATPLPGPPVRGAVLVFHDTTELRRLERLRQEFVSNVSHELKTPLSVIKACVETLLDGGIDDEVHRGPFLQRIADQSDQLHALILDLLNLARIESGGEIFEFHAMEPAVLVEEGLEHHRLQAEGKGLRLEAENCQGLPAIWADAEAFGQIIDNLVDNAIKYTPSGRVVVRGRVENNQVCLEVEDTGIGISERDLPRIFERFYRVDRARSRELGGTGLGLSIVKHLVQAMHGSIKATSRLGKGSVFTVRLPQARIT